MGNLLAQLENNEAILLMYLAEELGAEDRAEVEQMLAADAGLRAMLAELSAVQQSVNGAIAQADATLILSRRESAVRRVSRAMGARIEEQSEHRDASAAPARRLRMAWWAYPIAAAAMLLVGVMIYSNNHPLRLGPVEQPAQVAIVMPEILPAANPEDPLNKVEKELLSLRSSDDFFEALSADSGQ